MDSGLALRAPRNDNKAVAHAAAFFAARNFETSLMQWAGRGRFTSPQQGEVDLPPAMRSIVRRKSGEGALPHTETPLSRPWTDVML
ncbi:hypothetical protein GCM10010987_29510 [Bradyrhizobium guangdongense]|uniref:Transposase n=1 Tax=Bradyrhizobium guangdongense TaxID=1325090 RepID=A0A410VE21_9BRAD|nr:hypothetical protein X265_32660 [Bradyrhizobium guangdongense]QOZ62971.1 hypothetical protein XH86_32695 [Bradyrhizobium guangdongense]GGI24462.1 hypothetical protein GCM10010987_29510 [Bradyrhizobium guangdongense]